MADEPESVRRALEGTLLGGDRRYTRVQVVDAAGVSLERAKRLWTAMGFAEVGDDDVVFTDGDIEALRAWDGLVSSGVIDPDNEVSLARAIGQTLSRLAEWQAREVLSRVRELDGEPADLAALAAGLLPSIEHLQGYVWRRQLAAASGRILSTAGGELTAQTMVVGFADIVGYTSTTRHSDADELSALLEAFEEDAAETIVAHHGRVVKTVGDEVLFVVDDSEQAARIGVLLADPARVERGLPVLRVGLARGRVLSRFGDVYGSTVNLAARLTALARPGTALVDKELADALRADDRFQLRARRPTAVRGYHHLRSWVLRWTDESSPGGN